MIESAIYFSIGFLCAALLALMLAPAIAGRARRLANARARLLAPLTEAQARAERDALRAVQAVETVRLEKKAASAEWDRALARTDLARESARLLKAVANLDDMTAALQRHDAARAQLEFHLHAAEAESGAKDIALLDYANQRDAAQRGLAAARTRLAAQESQIDRQRVEIATLSTQVSALEVELADRRAQPLRGFSSDLDLEQRLRRSDAARADQTLEIARMMRGIAERNAALGRAEAEHDALRERLTAAERNAETIEADLRGQLQALKEQFANARGAMTHEDETRRILEAEIEALKSRLENASQASDALTRGDASLRLAIAKLGRDFVRSRAPQDEETQGAQIVNFARRDP